jgi:hypothetical protein
LYHPVAVIESDAEVPELPMRSKTVRFVVSEKIYKESVLAVGELPKSVERVQEKEINPAL